MRAVPLVFGPLQAIVRSRAEACMATPSFSLSNTPLGGTMRIEFGSTGGVSPAGPSATRDSTRKTVGASLVLPAKSSSLVIAAGFSL